VHGAGVRAIVRAGGAHEGGGFCSVEQDFLTPVLRAEGRSLV
jgi:hypothetical protein